MADEPIGKIPILIVGDYSPLAEDINTATGLAAEGGQKIAGGMNAGADGADRMKDAMAALKDQVAATGGELVTEADSAANTSTVFDNLSRAAQDLIAKQATLEQNVRTAQEAYVELRQAYADGAIGAATLMRAQDDLDAAITRANPQLASMVSQIDATKQAFMTLGVTSADQMQRTADTYRQAYDTIKASGTATVSELQQSWIAMEQARQAAAIQSGQIVSQAERDALANAKAPIEELKQEYTSLQDRLETLGTAFTDVGKILSVAITVPLTAIGAALIKVGTDFDEASDTIRARTGLIGDQLQAINTSFDSVAANVPNKIADVTQSFVTLHDRLGLMGAPLEAISTQVLNLSRITGEQLGPLVENASKVFQRWHIDTQDMAGALDKLYYASTQTGTGVNTMLGMLRQFAPALQEMGFSFDQATALIAKFEQAGLNTQRDITALQQAMLKLGKAGMADPVEGLQLLIDGIKGAGTQGQANAIGLKAFGRGAVDMVDAIRSGKLNLDDFVKSMQNHSGAIAAAAKDTLSFSDQLKLLGNNLEVAARPAAEAFLKVLGDVLTDLKPAVDEVGKLAKSFADLDPQTQKAIIAIGAVAGAAGPAALAVGSIVTAIGTIAPAIAAATPALEVIGGSLLAIHLSGADTAILNFAGAVQRSIPGLRDLFQPVIDSIKNIDKFLKDINPDLDTIKVTSQAMIDGILPGWRTLAVVVNQAAAAVAFLGGRSKEFEAESARVRAEMNLGTEQTLRLGAASLTAAGNGTQLTASVNALFGATTAATPAHDALTFSLSKGQQQSLLAEIAHTNYGGSVTTTGAAAKDAIPFHTGVSTAIGGTVKPSNDATAALEALLGSHKKTVLSLGELISKNAELNANLNLAEGVYAQVTERIKGGSREYNLQTEALKQLIAAHKALGDAETNVATIVASTEQANSQLTAKIIAQMQAYEKLDAEYGKDNLLTIQAQNQFEKLAKQVGLTAIQFGDLVNEFNKTGEPLGELVNKAGAVASAFKEMGITSSAQFEQMAQDAHDSLERITADVNSTSHDKYLASEQDIAETNKLRDAQSGAADAAKILGIQTVQMLQDLVDKYQRAADQIGVSLSSIASNHKNVQKTLDDLRLAVDPVARAYADLGIKSVAELTKIRDEEQKNLDLLRASGAEYGIIQQATEKLNKAQGDLNVAIHGVGDTGVNTGTRIKGAFDLASISVKGLGSAAGDDIIPFQLLEAQAVKAGQAIADAFAKATGSITSSAYAAAAAGQIIANAGKGSSGGSSGPTYSVPPGTFGGGKTSGGSATLGSDYGDAIFASGGIGIITGMVGNRYASAQDEVDALMAKGYSFGDARSRARFDGWDVSGVVDKSSKPPSSGNSASNQSAIENAAAAVNAAYQSGDQTALANAQANYAKVMAPPSVGSAANGGQNLVPGLSAEDVAAFLATGLTLDQLKAATAPSTTTTPTSSLVGMQGGEFTLPVGAVMPPTGLGTSSLMSMQGGEFSVPVNVQTPAGPGPSSLVGMSGGSFTSTAPTSTYTGAGMTLAQVQAAQVAGGAQDYWKNLFASTAPVSPPTSTTASVPAPALQYFGGLTPTSTVESVTAALQQQPPGAAPGSTPASVSTATSATSATTTPDYFKELGIASSQSLKDLAQQAVQAYAAIRDSGTASQGDIDRAAQAMVKATQSYSDSLTTGVAPVTAAAQTTADAFKTLGVASSDQLKTVADQAKAAYETVVLSSTSSSGDIARAFDAMQKATTTYTDSLSAAVAPLPAAADTVATAFQALGLTSTNQLKATADAATAAYNTIAESGTASAGDVQRAFDAMNKATQTYADSINAVADQVMSAADKVAGDFQTLGLTSSAKLLESAKADVAAYQDLVSSGMASAGDIQRAYDTTTKAIKAYTDSLNAVTPATPMSPTRTMTGTAGQTINVYSAVSPQDLAQALSIPAPQTAPTLPQIQAPMGAIIPQSGTGNATTMHTGGGQTIVNVYATVSTQALSDSLVAQIQSMGTMTGRLS